MIFLTVFGIRKQPGSHVVQDGDASEIIRHSSFEVPPRLEEGPVVTSVLVRHAPVERGQEAERVNLGERDGLAVRAFILEADDLEALLLHLAQDRQQLLLVLAMFQDSVNRLSVYGYPGEHIKWGHASVRVSDWPSSAESPAVLLRQWDW